ncbi:dihydropteroate synthase [Prevotellamassilia timonensis]|uniref:dihydropteroate synthase n=2 Tax=Prevotellamassilia timonensis TaxID=1852370 RepID=UPI003080D097
MASCQYPRIKTFTTLTHTLNLRGRLLELREPQIMGILNVTPDSFYSDSRTPDEAHITDRVRQMMDEGADMIDVGGYSSRPGADDVTPEEEMDRLRRGLRIVRKLYPEVPVSVDTFRADVARMCIEEEGADIINDISGGMMDRQMFRTVARLGVPYILMHMQGTPDTMQVAPHYDNLRREVMLYFAERIDRLCQMGAKDIIVDPGFGFGKTLEHNYELMNHLEDFAVFNLPLLVGISRKSMIYKLTGGTPQTSLNGTTVLNTISLVKGAHILRVHDVKAAAEAKQIYMAMKQNA